MEHIDLVGETVLVLDDEVMLAFDMKAILANAGAVVITATNAEEAMLLADNAAVSLAVLDVKLARDHSCEHVCVRLAELGIPFVFYTAYDVNPVFDRWPNAIVIEKPASPAVVVETLKGLATRSGIEVADNELNRPVTSPPCADDATGPRPLILCDTSRR